MANTKTAYKISKLFAIKNVSDHSISLALEQATAGTASNNARSILNGNRRKNSEYARKFIWLTCAYVK